MEQDPHPDLTLYRALRNMDFYSAAAAQKIVRGFFSTVGYDFLPILFLMIPLVKAIIDYSATIEEEFDFQIGDIIAVTATLMMAGERRIAR